MKNIILKLCSITCLLLVFEVSKANHNFNDSIVTVTQNLPMNEPLGSMLQNKTSDPGKPGRELKRLIFSAVVTPRFSTTVPPINLYFEHGIAGLASLGLTVGGTYHSEPEIDYHAATVTVGLRACGYVFPIIARASKKEISSFGFQPFLGVGYDYYITAESISDNDINPVNYSNVGLCAGTRWYPGKSKFALLAEFNSNGIGNNFRAGISLGK